jgi:protein-S-isoprenylcysteine O-methyltransferase Ste14
MIVKIRCARESLPMIKQTDTAGVIAPPPLLALAVIVLGLLLDWLLPAYVLSLLLSLTTRIVIAAILALAGGALAFSAERSFHRAGTDAMPWKPTSALVTRGIYGRVRNPMYVGLGLLVAGIGIGLASDWTLVMLVAGAFVLHFGVVKREERYLAAKFGEPYRTYTEQVPRYGWPF